MAYLKGHKRAAPSYARGSPIDRRGADGPLASTKIKPARLVTASTAKRHLFYEITSLLPGKLFSTRSTAQWPLCHPPLSLAPLSLAIAPLPFAKRRESEPGDMKAVRHRACAGAGASALPRGIVPNGEEIIMQSLKTVLASLAITMAVTGTAASEPLLIRNSYVVPIDWQPLLVAKKDLANHWGKSYVMEAVRYQGTPPMITALANGELEIAALAYSTLGIAVENAGISDLRVISDQFRDGVSGYFSNQFFVRKDSGIKKIEDLKGKVLATNAIGAGVDIAMKAGLKKHGLIDKRDYTVIEAPFPTMPAM
jgi:hypothetical protein